jgi:ABC-type multidrug transport system ATPase subunit
MRATAINVDAISRAYGNYQAVKSVSFQAHFGEVTGLIGPNGAGKTTLIRIICSLLRPDAGSVSICGVKMPGGAAELRKKIGVLPERAGIYEKLTVYENISFYASFYAIEDMQARIVSYTSYFGLKDKIHALGGSLSEGMKKKVLIIRTVIHDPDVIILDEPLSALDPDSRISLKKLLGTLKNQGKAILMSSHELLEVENMCDKVILIGEGRVLVNEYIQALKERFKGDRLPTLEDIYMTLRRSRSADGSDATG